MATTETQSLTIESAADLLVQPEEGSEVSEEVLEAEDAQPEEDANSEAEDYDEDAEDDTEESVVDSDDEDEYESEESEPAEEDPQSVFTVKVDGEEVEVTLDQLKQGYSGQKYVQKGMQQAAEARKQAEAVYQALAQERQNLQQLVAGIQQGGIAPPVEPSREMFTQDPVGYMEAKMEYEDRLNQWNAVQQQLNQQSQAESQARQEHARREAQVLMEKIPELRDAKTAAQFKNDIVHAATEYYGFPEEVLGNITNHNELLVLRDAMLYRKMMANEGTVKNKAKKARPVIKPGTKKVTTNNDVARKQRAQLKKSGSVEDALALMFK